MKKLAVITAMVLVGAGVAYASYLSVPWFVDNGVIAADIPHNFTNAGARQSQVTGIVTLKSNRTDNLTCEITYFSQEGYRLGPFAPDNTFNINPLSALAFRPVQCDPDATVTALVCDDNGDGTPDRAGVNGGQEGGAGVLVPDRPLSIAGAPIPGAVDGQGQPLVDNKKNGAIVIEWQGDDTDVQGQVAYFQTSLVNGARVTYSYAHLLPPGV
ncbi:MAG: hypothetical protein IT368_08110 [Candidatus Hydrogenedentes bacterium]|nr:hypothetical protein [Candidatus Hydrogenedentota bacterium]